MRARHVAIARPQRPGDGGAEVVQLDADTRAPLRLLGSDQAVPSLGRARPEVSGVSTPPVRLAIETTEREVAERLEHLEARGRRVVARRADHGLCNQHAEDVHDVERTERLVGDDAFSGTKVEATGEDRE